MTHRAVLRRATFACGALVLAGLANIAPAQPAAALPCFTVVDKMTCIDAALAPPATFMPPVIAPIGANGEGEDHRIVIEDDGGRRVARG